MRAAPFRTSTTAHAGFTLIEILVVLAILALAIAVLPSPFAGLTGVRLRAAADEMVDTLRKLHDRAIRQGIMTEMALDPQAVTYTLSGLPSTYRLPPVVDAVVSMRQHFGADGVVHIKFFADGSATGETMKLMHGNSARQVSIEWLTGRVHRDD